jgi:hypothetical protein
MFVQGQSHHFTQRHGPASQWAEIRDLPLVNLNLPKSRAISTKPASLNTDPKKAKACNYKRGTGNRQEQPWPQNPPKAESRDGRADKRFAPPH